jgi:hypothetical protein
MNDVERYISARKRRDPEFARGFESGYERFKARVLREQSQKKARPQGRPTR